MSPRIAVARYNPQHSHYLALALQEGGMLEAYYTGLYLSSEHPPLRAFRFLPAMLRKRMERHLFARFRRQIPGLDVSRIHALAWGTNAAQALLFRAGVKSPWLLPFFRNQGERFQRRVAAVSQATADVLVLYDCDAFHALDATRSSDLIRVVELAATHPVTHDEIYRTEAAKWPEFARHLEIYAQRPERYARLCAEVDLADYLLVEAAWVKTACAAQGYDPERIFVVPLGCDLDRFHPPPTPRATNGPLRILTYIGNPSLVKGLPYVLGMLSRLKSDVPIELVCYGIGEFVLPPSFDLGHIKITRHGLLPHGEVAALMREVDLLCHPTILEGFSFTVAEAMASGLPVITTADRSGVAEIITHGHDGFVVPLGDVEGMAAIVRRLHGEPALRRAVGQAARQTIEAYSWDAYGTRIVRIFAEIARRGKPERRDDPNARTASA